VNILVSNDDGILAPGISLLADACRAVGQVTVVAPDREQSGTSHSLTLHRPLRPSAAMTAPSRWTALRPIACCWPSAP
jgi:5'-nucleotidase